MSIDFSSMIDVRIAIILWCIGWVIKHSKNKYIKKIPNDAIPIILMAIGVIISCIMVGDVTTNSLIIGAVTSIFAVGVHSSGKNIFKLSENTTIYATQDNIKNNLAKQEKDNMENNTSTINYGNYDDFSDMGAVSDDDSLDVGETIIGGGNAVG